LNRGVLRNKMPCYAVARFHKVGSEAFSRVFTTLNY
jgi:hypothetical protein